VRPAAEVTAANPPWALGTATVAVLIVAGRRPRARYHPSAPCEPCCRAAMHVSWVPDS
jgi:hypothetical protein